MIVPQNKKQDSTIHKIGNKIINPKQLDVKSDPSIKVKNESK